MAMTDYERGGTAPGLLNGYKLQCKCIMDFQIILVTGGPGFIGTSPLRELESYSGNCFGARSAHSPDNLKKRAVN